MRFEIFRGLSGGLYAMRLPVGRPVMLLPPWNLVRYWLGLDAEVRGLYRD